jgi:hypothetical protein
MTPQQLIDLKGYGSAEKQLRKMGKWKLTPQEEFENKLGKIMGSIDDAISSIQSAENDLEYSLSDLSKIQTKLED